LLIESTASLIVLRLRSPMIDLHCHILPGIDDGARDLATSLAMAEAFVAQGVRVVACTPHILPGLYHNTGPGIRAAVAALQAEVDRVGLPLHLTTGADVHIAPGLVAGLRSGQILSLGDSRYVLIEPPHHVLPARFDETLFELMLGGFVPIITHPERLSWLGAHYALIQKLASHGVWMQITAGSLSGKFGKTALNLARRMLDEGIVHIVATDAHDMQRRRPDLAEARDTLARLVGPDEAEALVAGRPLGILHNTSPEELLMRGAGRSVDGGAMSSGRVPASRGGVGDADDQVEYGVGGSLSRIRRRLFGFLQ